MERERNRFFTLASPWKYLRRYIFSTLFRMPCPSIQVFTLQNTYPPLRFPVLTLFAWKRRRKMFQSLYTLGYPSGIPLIRNRVYSPRSPTICIIQINFTIVPNPTTQNQRELLLLLTEYSAGNLKPILPIGCEVRGHDIQESFRRVELQSDIRSPFINRNETRWLRIVIRFYFGLVWSEFRWLILARRCFSLVRWPQLPKGHQRRPRRAPKLDTRSKNWNSPLSYLRSRFQLECKSPIKVNHGSSRVLPLVNMKYSDTKSGRESWLARVSLTTSKGRRGVKSKRN